MGLGLQWETAAFKRWLLNVLARERRRNLGGFYCNFMKNDTKKYVSVYARTSHLDPLAGLVPPRPLLPHVMALQTSLAPAHSVLAAFRVASRSPAVALAPWLPAAWALASAQLVQGRQPCPWLRVLFWLLACALRSSLPLGDSCSHPSHLSQRPALLQ